MLRFIVSLSKADCQSAHKFMNVGRSQGGRFPDRKVGISLSITLRIVLLFVQ